MKTSGDIFDFTSGKAPAGVSSPVAHIQNATRALLEELPSGPGAPMPTGGWSATLDRFNAAIAGPAAGAGVSAKGLKAARLGGEDQWVAAVRHAVREAFGAYCVHQQVLPSADLALALARSAVEAIRWGLICRQAPETEPWAELGRLFLRIVEATPAEMGEEGMKVEREYVRALAYHSLALDQLSLNGAWVVCRLADVLLPFVVLQANPSGEALYAVSPPDAPIPLRLPNRASACGWCFVPSAASDVLAELHGQLLRGTLPAALAGGDLPLLAEAAAHVRRQWSHRPPIRRFRRHVVDAELLVVRGYDQAKKLFEAKTSVDNAEWLVTDLSRGGVGALVLHTTGQSRPESGDLLAFRPSDGSNWHLGVVRRVRFSGGHAEVGIETLSPRPALVRVDDGRSPFELFFCDPVQRGEAVRILAPRGLLNDGVSLFVTADGRVSKLKPLDISLQGEDYDLRVYQVL